MTKLKNDEGILEEVCKEELEINKNKLSPKVKLDTFYEIPLLLGKGIKNKYYTSINRIEYRVPNFDTKLLSIVLGVNERVVIELDSNSEYYPFLSKYKNNDFEFSPFLKLQYNLNGYLINIDEKWYIVIVNNGNVRVEIFENDILAKLYN